MKEEDEEKIRCKKCGKFMKCSSFLSEGSSEMVSCKCKCGNELVESY